MAEVLRSCDEVTESVLEKAVSGGEVVPGFAGIGRVRGRTDYSPAERTVLDYFFTNSHSNIYAARDSLPNELWALLMGQYARSHLTARDRLLKLVRDIREQNTDAPSVEELADLIDRNREVDRALVLHKKRAGEFIDEHGAPYGHASLRDSDVTRMCMEGVSQRSTKFWEDVREAAFQEQSTRGIRFVLESLGIPYEIMGTRYETILKDVNIEAMRVYDQAIAVLVPHLKRKFAYLREEADDRLRAALGSGFKPIPDKKWDGFIQAKAFDVARSLLPQNMTTSLGMTMTSRRFQDKLSEWQSLPFAEMRVIGKVAQIEGRKVSPVILKYGNPSPFYKGLPDLRRKSFDEFVGAEAARQGRSYSAREVSTKLIAVTPDIEDWVLASILFNGRGDLSLESLKGIVAKLSPEQRHEIARREMEGRKGFELYPKSMEIGSFTFEREYDIGAFRDLQRQRGDRQQYTPYNVIGFVIPPEMEEVGLGPCYRHVMTKARVAYETFKEAGLEYVAEYIPLMGNMLRHVVTRDPVQGFYEAGLRTQAAGIDSYRAIKNAEIKIELEHLPSFKGLVAFDPNVYHLGRLEEFVQREIRKATQGEGR